jgi:hypothetical protein
MKLVIELDFDTKEQIESFKKEFESHFGIEKENMFKTID